MGCFCSCFRPPQVEEYAEFVSNNHTEGNVSNNQNRAPLSYLTQIFKNKYGVVSGKAGLHAIPSSAQKTDIATTEVGTNTTQDILLENSSSSGNLELQGHVVVTRNGAGLGPLQLGHGTPEGQNVQVKGPVIATTEVGTNTPRGTLLQNSSTSKNLELQGYVAVQGNAAGSGPLQLEHGPPEGRNVKVNLRSKSKDNAGGFSKDNKSKARRLASPANVSSEKIKTEHKDYFCSTRDEIECPTCLEEYSDENPKITSKCNHHFHLGCIYEWMERSSTCPICLKEMKFAENI